VSVVQMRVVKYIPAKLYGFLSDSETGQEAFFHLGAFQPGDGWDKPPQCSICALRDCSWSTSPPPPILGELVRVEVDFDQDPQEGKVPRASKVERISNPAIVKGSVETFDAHRGYGFVIGDDGESYHLHKSELVEDRIPRAGQLVMFYAGVRMNRPRACHIKICPI